MRANALHISLEGNKLLRRRRNLVIALIVVVAAAIVLVALGTQPDLLGLARPRSGPPAPSAGPGVAVQPPTGDEPGGVAPPSNAPPTTDPGTVVAADPIDPQAAAAVAAERGLTIAEAMRRLAQERASGDLGERIVAGLQGRTGGYYLDRDGQLVVTTLDDAGDNAARAGGAKPQRVDDSSAHLDEIMQALNKQATDKGAGSVQGWYIDVPNNTVVVTATEGSSDATATALLDRARAFGASVRIELVPADQAPQPAVYLVGGAQYRLVDVSYVCSVGFNTRTSANYNVVLTAGHCTKGTGWITKDGYRVGRVRTSNFPRDDYGTFWNEYPSYWVPSVSVFKYNGTYVNVRGSWGNPPVGTSICKSGRTTGYTCGVITALNQTVTYPEGTIYQLVRHTACVEGGDSGGSNISSGGYALGVTSGASTPKTTGLCLSKIGQQNVSWYQPITEALTANGLTLLFQP